MRKHNSESVSKKHLARNISERTSKRRGELAELAFLWKAASLGFTVAKPYGDSDRYDFIVDSGGRLIRVQVKSASRLSHGTYFITTQRCRNGVAIPYTSDEIDFLAGYLFPEDAWVVVPVEALAGRTSIHIFPRDRADAGLYASYREAWCQLACPREQSESSQPISTNLNIGPRCRGRHNSNCPQRDRPQTWTPAPSLMWVPHSIAFCAIEWDQGCSEVRPEIFSRRFSPVIPTRERSGRLNGITRFF